jgi:hypothetical protein
MQNVSRNETIAQRIVWQVDGVSPQPGCDLVVFERVGKGKRFHKKVSSEETFQEGILKRVLGVGPQWIAYAVSRNDNLSYQFTTACTSREGMGPLAVNFSLHFAVDSSERVATLLESDPLWMLANMMQELAHRAVAGLAWDAIENGSVGIEKIILKSESPVEGGDTASNEEILKSLALQLGFRLKFVTILTDLPSMIPEGRGKLRALHRDEELEEAVARKKIREVERENELASRRGRADDLRRLERAATDAKITIMNQAATNIPEGIGGIRAMAQEFNVVQTSSGQASPPGGTGLPFSPNPVGLTAGRGEALPDMVAQLLAVAREVHGPRRNRLLSTGLKLLAEAALGPAANKTIQSQLTTEMNEMVKSLFADDVFITPDQQKLLTTLQDPAALKHLID